MCGDGLIIGHVFSVIGRTLSVRGSCRSFSFFLNLIEHKPWSQARCARCEQPLNAYQARSSNAVGNGGIANNIARQIRTEILRHFLRPGLNEVLPLFEKNGECVLQRVGQTEGGEGAAKACTFDHEMAHHLC